MKTFLWIWLVLLLGLIVATLIIAATGFALIFLRDWLGAGGLIGFVSLAFSAYVAALITSGIK